jgi:hypothetical protein
MATPIQRIFRADNAVLNDLEFGDLVAGDGCITHGRGYKVRGSNGTHFGTYLDIGGNHLYVEGARCRVRGHGITVKGVNMEVIGTDITHDPSPADEMPLRVDRLRHAPVSADGIDGGEDILSTGIQWSRPQQRGVVDTLVERNHMFDRMLDVPMPSSPATEQVSAQRPADESPARSVPSTQAGDDEPIGHLAVGGQNLPGDEEEAQRRRWEHFTGASLTPRLSATSSAEFLGLSPRLSNPTRSWSYTHPDTFAPPDPNPPPVVPQREWRLPLVPRVTVVRDGARHVDATEIFRDAILGNLDGLVRGLAEDRLHGWRDGPLGQTATPRIRIPPRAPESEKEDAPADTPLEKLCIFCASKWPTQVIVPCGHVYSCWACVSKSTPKTCAICREPVTGVVYPIKS